MSRTDDTAHGPPTGRRVTRRRVLGLAAAASAVAVAGCAGGDDGGDATTTTTATTTMTTNPTATTAGNDATASDATETTTASDATETTTASDGAETTTASDGGLDLREANVTAVSVEGGDGVYDFDVTLYHDDDGEEGYADWWQVETLDGTRLGRRDLVHPHGTREFTRSASVEVPADVTTVVVRGHDQTHGYGGQAMLVHLDTGETEAVQQGPDPQSFADRA